MRCTENNMEIFCCVTQGRNSDRGSVVVYNGRETGGDIGVPMADSF